MQAKDIMTPNVVTVTPNTSVRDIAELLLERQISALPVVDAAQKVVGIVSEGDLLRRPETGTERRRSWWLSLFSSPEERAAEYVKGHGRRAEEVMTRDVVTVKENAPLNEIAELLERWRIKRVPVVRGGKLVGIISRANVIRGLVAHGEASAPTTDDRAIQEKILQQLKDDVGIWTDTLNVIVKDGVVHLWGMVETEEEKEAVQVVAENIAGVQAVENRIARIPSNLRARSI